VEPVPLSRFLRFSADRVPLTPPGKTDERAAENLKVLASGSEAKLILGAEKPLLAYCAIRPRDGSMVLPGKDKRYRDISE
jgi:hypothetical protein